MTKSEMHLTFTKLMDERNNIIGDMDLETAISLSIEEKREVVNKSIDNTIEVVGMLAEYVLESLQPFSDGSIVWTAYALDHLSKKMRQTFDEKQKGLFSHISLQMISTETTVIKVDMSQFPGGMKNE